MKNFVGGAFAAFVIGAMSVSAQAADLPSIKAPPPPPVVDTYQPFQVRLKVGGVIPLDGGSTIYDAGALNPVVLGAGGPLSFGLATLRSGGPGTVVPGATTSISWSVIPMLDVAYYLNKNWAIEAICCVSHHHIQGTGVLAGSSLARTWVFPPSLLLQYHFTNFGAFQPYLGVGVNFTTFWGVRVNNDTWGIPFAAGSALAGLGVPGVTSTFQWATVAPSWGPVGQVGFDYMFNENWGVNVDFKYMGLHPMVHATAVAFAPTAPALGPIFLPVKVSLPINPIVISAGITYRFGGGLLQPVLANF